MMFGERLKELRKSKGVTQEQLAAIIGVERSSIGKYEGKAHTIPSDDVKERIADYFDVTIDYLIGKTDDPHPIILEYQLTDIERRLIMSFRNLNEEGQEKTVDYVDDLISSAKYIKMHSPGMVEGA